MALLIPSHKIRAAKRLRKNLVTLGDSSNIDKDLKPFKVDGKTSILEVS